MSKEQAQAQARVAFKRLLRKAGWPHDPEASTVELAQQVATVKRLGLLEAQRSPVLGF